MSGKVHPLIFESSTEEDSDTVRLRSLPFFEELLADRSQSKYLSLNLDMRRIVGLGVRDLFLASWHGYLNDRETHILNEIVKILDESVACTQVKGMKVSFHPTANFKVVKFIEPLDERLDPFFAQIMDTPKLFVVFVDPAELSYHNFENVVHLDRWIEWKQEDALTLSLTDVQNVQPGREVFMCSLNGPSCGLLEDLSRLNLYVPHLIKRHRAGKGLFSIPRF